jgi:hypothetical protein
VSKKVVPLFRRGVPRLIGLPLNPHLSNLQPCQPASISAFPFVSFPLRIREARWLLGLLWHLPALGKS